MALRPVAGKPPFQALFDEHAATVLRFLRRMLPPAEAEDAAQEAFVAALEAYPRFDGLNPRAWLLTIARRKALDEIRSRSRRATEELDAEAVTVAFAEPPADAEIWQGVRALPPKQRAAMVMRYRFDLRYREIGALLDCSEAAARQNVHEGLSKLRETYGAHAHVEART